MSDSVVIYILTNPSFPLYVKIGYAKDLQRRLRELNRSEALPYAFRAYATYDVAHKLTDKTLYKLIDQLNPDLRTIETFNGKTRTKEFFEMSPEDAYSILEAIATISGTTNHLHRLTPTWEQLEDEKRAESVRHESGTTKRPRFRFSMVGIQVGDTVAFVDDPTKVATVVDDLHVECDGVTTSLSRLASELTGSNHALQGPLYFTYNGERLTDLRDRLELIAHNADVSK